MVYVRATAIRSIGAHMEIQSVNLGRRLALTQDNQILNITKMIDEFGDDTDDPAEAVSFVAGPTSSGQWIAEEVGSFDFGTAKRVH